MPPPTVRRADAAATATHASASRRAVSSSANHPMRARPEDPMPERPEYRATHASWDTRKVAQKSVTYADRASHRPARYAVRDSDWQEPTRIIPYWLSSVVQKAQNAIRAAGSSSVFQV